MVECPICRKAYDGRFQVFVPPHYEAFDTVACARRAAELWGWDKSAPIPVILPTIESVQARPETQVASVARRRKVAALAGFELATGQAALATGVGLLAAGTAASIYLWARPGTHSSPIAAGAPTTGQTIGPLPAAPRPLATGSPQTRPAADAASRPQFAAFTDAGGSAGTSGEGAPTFIANVQPGPLPSTSSGESAESAAGPPSQAPKPTPSPPKPPPVTQEPPSSGSPPTAPASPPVQPPATGEPPLIGEGGVTPAIDGAPQSPTNQSNASKPPPSEEPPPPTLPPPTSPPPTTPTDSSGPEPGDGCDDGDEGDEHAPSSDTRPGNGWGDTNHDHTGPPGQDGNESGSSAGTGTSHGRGR